MTPQDELDAMNNLCWRGIWWHLDAAPVSVDTIIQEIATAQHRIPRNMLDVVAPYRLWSELLDSSVSLDQVKFWTHDGLKRVVVHHAQVHSEFSRQLVHDLLIGATRMVPANPWSHQATALAEQLAHTPQNDAWIAWVRQFVERTECCN